MTVIKPFYSRPWKRGRTLGEKIERMKKGEGYKAFIDPEGYRVAINAWQNDFIARLVKEAMVRK